MALYCGYAGAVRCADGSQPGARALMAWFLGAYGSRGGTNLGIYLCRVISGSTTLSVHAEGRACDLGMPLNAPWGQPLCDALVRHSRALGIQCVIYRGRIWSGARCNDGWRTYVGSDPHDRHAHVELDWHAAVTLTVAAINEAMGGTTMTAADVWNYNTGSSENPVTAVERLRRAATELAAIRATGGQVAGVSTALATRVEEVRTELLEIGEGIIAAVAGLANQVEALHTRLDTIGGMPAGDLAIAVADELGSRLTPR